MKSTCFIIEDIPINPRIVRGPIGDLRSSNIDSNLTNPTAPRPTREAIPSLIEVERLNKILEHAVSHLQCYERSNDKE